MGLTPPPLLSLPIPGTLFRSVSDGLWAVGGEITWIKWNVAQFAQGRRWACMHASVCEEACNGGGLLGAHQSMLHPPQLHIKLKSVPHCVRVNDPGGTPTPTALHTFPSPLARPRVWPSSRGLRRGMQPSPSFKTRAESRAEATGIKFMFTQASWRHPNTHTQKANVIIRRLNQGNLQITRSRLWV